MEELAEYRQEILSLLESGVDELRKLAKQIPPDAWYTRHNPYGHPPHYLLAHLQALELHVFSTQLRRIVEEDTPQLSAFDEAAWMDEYFTAAPAFQAILEEFSSLRRQEVAWLRGLSDESWSRTARHPWWGLHTLQWFVEHQLEISTQHIHELSNSNSG